MYCVCNKISFKDIFSIIHDYHFSLDNLIENGICGNKCELCLPHLEKLIKDIKDNTKTL